MKITRVVKFSAAHRLRKHSGKCRRLHGHNYTAIVSIEGTEGKDGMVVDFGVIDKEIKDIFDHKTILHKDDELAKLLPAEYVVLTDFEPTCENLARYISKLLSKYGEVSVILYETDNSFVVV